MVRKNIEKLENEGMLWEEAGWNVRTTSGSGRL